MEFAKEKPEDYSRIKQLINEGKNDEALQLIDKFKEKGEYSLHDISIYNLLKCEILYQQGLYIDLFKLAEQIYQGSLGLEDKLLSLDALFIMAEAFIWFGETNKAEEIIKQAEEHLKIIPQELKKARKQREAHLFFVKGFFYTRLKNEPDLAMEHLEHSIELGKEFNAELEVARSFAVMTWALSTLKGELDHALKVLEETETFVVKINNKYGIAAVFLYKATIFSQKGELDRSIEIFEQSLKLFKELNNKPFIANVFNRMSDTYLKKGDLDRALGYIEQSLAINKELGSIKNTVDNYQFLIQILIEKKDMERAQQALHDFEQLNNQLKDKHVNLLYLFNKAILLKTSPRAPKRGEAEEILKQILRDEDITYELAILTLLNLCELLLIELQMLNDLEILKDIESHIAQLINIAETSHSYILLAEIYYLKAELALLTLDVKKARRFLTQAQRIAERWNFVQLATKISSEHDRLRNQTSMWEQLKESDISLAERIKLAGLDKQMNQLLQKGLTLTSQVKEETVTIHKDRKICLVCKGYVLGFMFTCSCDTIYCENCARALTHLENVCWVCNAPIDISKPTKLYNEEELDEEDEANIIYKKPKNR